MRWLLEVRENQAGTGGQRKWRRTHETYMLWLHRGSGASAWQARINSGILTFPNCILFTQHNVQLPCIPLGHDGAAELQSHFFFYLGPYFIHRENRLLWMAPTHKGACVFILGRMSNNKSLFSFLFFFTMNSRLLRRLCSMDIKGISPPKMGVLWARRFTAGFSGSHLGYIYSEHKVDLCNVATATFHLLKRTSR